MAYGAVPAPKKATPLDVRIYRIPERAATAAAAAIIAVPFDLSGGAESVPAALEQRLCDVFNDELAKGVTYPQRGPMSQDEFRSYFLSYDLIVGVLVSQQEAEKYVGHAPLTQDDDDVTLDAATISKASLLEGRDWQASYAFSYYIKPNYPGRSSHLCNAGFVVPPSQRGLGLGGVAGRSFLHYGPRAGYRGSVFNLVYANNEASVRIWERLGFTRVGRIPDAGLLRTGNGDEEIYVDAWVVHGDFDKLGKQGRSAAPAPAPTS